eukprot:3065840-Amphidinium_carterae.1
MDSRLYHSGTPEVDSYEPGSLTEGEHAVDFCEDRLRFGEPFAEERLEFLQQLGDHWSSGHMLTVDNVTLSARITLVSSSDIHTNCSIDGFCEARVNVEFASTMERISAMGEITVVCDRSADCTFGLACRAQDACTSDEIFAVCASVYAHTLDETYAAHVSEDTNALDENFVELTAEGAYALMRSLLYVLLRTPTHWMSPLLPRSPRTPTPSTPYIRPWMLGSLRTPMTLLRALMSVCL